MMKRHEPASLFLSYSREDKALREELEKHLKVLQRQSIITVWHDRRITPGVNWAHAIDTYLNEASLILLLVSPNFIASDYCYSVEMQHALKRHEDGETRVIPIILRPCDWQEAPFAHLQGLPRDMKPVTSWSNRDEAFTNITQEIRKTIAEQAISVRPVLSSVDRQIRQQLLKSIREIWIDGVLEQSLHQAALLTLNLQERPDALANPWCLEVQETNRSPLFLPAGTSIVKVYDDADGELLILGEPGAGKTTLLLEIARALLERAEKDGQQRMPVVFHLPSWVEKCQPLRVWMEEELWTKYEVPHKTGRNLINTDQLLPLFDGLDEVATEEARIALVQEINNYRKWRQEKQYKDNPIVVCCRNTEYIVLSENSKQPKKSRNSKKARSHKNSESVKLRLRKAVYIHPLTDEQINTYLEVAGEQVEVLRQRLNEDADLHGLARQPLMLNIFTLAYQGARVSELPTGGTREEMRRTIFAKYVDRMLGRREQSRRWKPEQVRHGLTFLAKQMQQHDQTMFRVESLQPNWLPNRWRVISEQCMGPAFGLIVGLPTGLIAGWYSGLISGVLSWLFSKQLDKHFDVLSVVSNFSRDTRLSPNRYTWLYGAFGLFIGLVGALAIWLATRQVFGPVIVSGLIYVLLIGIDPFARHFLLRFLLSQRGDLPWHLVPFLDEVAGRLLLRKVGGSYMFVHRQLLDYFAGLDKPMASESTSSGNKTERHTANV